MPDLTAIGKIMGGGVPIAAFGGRADVMAVLAPDGADVHRRNARRQPFCVAHGAPRARPARSASRVLRADGRAGEASRRRDSRDLRAARTCRMRSCSTSRSSISSSGAGRRARTYDDARSADTRGVRGATITRCSNAASFCRPRRTRSCSCRPRTRAEDVDETIEAISFAIAMKSLEQAAIIGTSAKAGPRRSRSHSLRSA